MTYIGICHTYMIRDPVTNEITDFYCSCPDKYPDSSFSCEVDDISDFEIDCDGGHAPV